MAYVFPTNRELQAILPEKIARLSAERVGFEIMPMRGVNAGIVQWTQKDNYKGLQQLRGLDGAPAHVQRVGESLFSYTPGVYGEFIPITEQELTTRAGAVNVDTPIPVGDLVLDAQDLLAQRELDRIESIIWTLLTTGTFSITGPNGSSFADTFTLQTYSRITAWATVATSVPLQDFRAIALLGRGKGVKFGAGAKAYVNRSTFNNMMGNTNAGDLGGKRVLNGSTVNNQDGINNILNGEDLPTVVIYDEGYYDDTNTFQLFIPNNKMVVVGKRPTGDKIGEYVKTRNAQNAMMAPGSYSFVIDRTGNAPDGQKQVPSNLVVHAGHSGGPVVYHPGSIIVATV